MGSLAVNIIGAGRVGKTIGHLLVRHQIATIGAVCNQSKDSTLEAIQFIGAGNYCPSIKELPPADLTLITTPDKAIPPVCQDLYDNPKLRAGQIIIHCSGALSSESLISLNERKCVVASVHPMRSFAQPKVSVEEYGGTYCAVEGDTKALAVVVPLFQSIGSITYPIEKTKKSLYHAAGVFASNYLVTLADQALYCLQSAGLAHDMAMNLITDIMYSTVSNLKQTLSTQDSLTGPVQRADYATLKQHLDSLTDHDRKQLYALLGKASLDLTTHDQKTKEQLKLLFNTTLTKS